MDDRSRSAVVSWRASADLRRRVVDRRLARAEAADKRWGEGRGFDIAEAGDGVLFLGEGAARHPDNPVRFLDAGRHALATDPEYRRARERGRGQRGVLVRRNRRRRDRRRPQAPGRVEDRLRGHPDLPRRRARGRWFRVPVAARGVIGHIGHVSADTGSRGGIGGIGRRKARKRKARLGRRRRGVVARFGGFRGG